MVNLELGYVNNWFRANNLSLNVMKTNYILFTSSRKQIPPTEGILKISDVPIPVVSTTKFLGVYLDSYLTWNYHTDQISSFWFSVIDLPCNLFVSCQEIQ